eukprot:888185_1
MQFMIIYTTITTTNALCQTVYEHIPSRWYKENKVGGCVKTRDKFETRMNHWKRNHDRNNDCSHHNPAKKRKLQTPTHSTSESQLFNHVLPTSSIAPSRNARAFTCTVSQSAHAVPSAPSLNQPLPPSAPQFVPVVSPSKECNTCKNPFRGSGDDENNDDIDIVNLKHRSRTRKSIDDALAITVPHKFRISELPLYGSQLKYLIFTNDKQYQRRGNYYIICNSNNSNTNPPQPAHQQQPQTHNMPQPENEHQPQYASAASSPHNTNNQPFKPTIRTKESQLDQCNQSQLSEYEGVDPTASAVQPPNCDVCITDEIIIKKE